MFACDAAHTTAVCGCMCCAFDFLNAQCTLLAKHISNSSHGVPIFAVQSSKIQIFHDKFKFRLKTSGKIPPIQWWCRFCNLILHCKINEWNRCLCVDLVSIHILYEWNKRTKLNSIQIKTWKTTANQIVFEIFFRREKNSLSLFVPSFRGALTNHSRSNFEAVVVLNAHS